MHNSRQLTWSNSSHHWFSLVFFTGTPAGGSHTHSPVVRLAYMCSLVRGSMISTHSVIGGWGDPGPPAVVAPDNGWRISWSGLMWPRLMVLWGLRWPLSLSPDRKCRETPATYYMATDFSVTDFIEVVSSDSRDEIEDEGEAFFSSSSSFAFFLKSITCSGLSLQNDSFETEKKKREFRNEEKNSTFRFFR